MHSFVNQAIGTLTQETTIIFKSLGCTELRTGKVVLARISPQQADEPKLFFYKRCRLRNIY